MNNEIFIDWITISLIHEGQSLPIVAGGAVVFVAVLAKTLIEWLG